MGLQLNASNSLKQLAALLADELMKEGGDVFQKQWLVTQTNGMNNWLTIQLASHMGISANCSFLKPNDVIAQLYYWMGGDNKQVLAPDQLQCCYTMYWIRRNFAPGSPRSPATINRMT